MCSLGIVYLAHLTGSSKPFSIFYSLNLLTSNPWHYASIASSEGSRFRSMKGGLSSLFCWNSFWSLFWTSLTSIAAKENEETVIRWNELVLAKHTYISRKNIVYLWERDLHCLLPHHLPASFSVAWQPSETSMCLRRLLFWSWHFQCGKI